MTRVAPPPIQHPIVEASDKGLTDGISSTIWTQFFSQVYRGDTGEEWDAQFTDLTQVGAPEIKGRIYQLNKSVAFFSVLITPDTSTTATAGTTYINNFPLRMSGNGICFAVSGLLGSSSGMCESDTNRIYVPAWNAVTVPLTIIGIVEAV